MKSYTQTDSTELQTESVCTHIMKSYVTQTDSTELQTESVCTHIMKSCEYKQTVQNYRQNQFVLT